MYGINLLLFVLGGAIVSVISFTLHRGTVDYCGNGLCTVKRPDCSKKLSTRDSSLPLKCLNGFRLCKKVKVVEKIVLDVAKFSPGEYRTILGIRKFNVYHLPSTPNTKSGTHFRWKRIFFWSWSGIQSSSQ